MSVIPETMNKAMKTFFIDSLTKRLTGHKDGYGVEMGLPVKMRQSLNLV